MKVRNGFVSNSSSSSFVVSVDKPDLWDILSDVLDVRNTISTLKELDEFIIDNYGWKGQTVQDVLDDYGNKDWYYDAVKEIEAGNKVIYVSADYGDETAYKIVNKFNILEGEC